MTISCRVRIIHGRHALKGCNKIIRLELNRLCIKKMELLHDESEEAASGSYATVREVHWNDSKILVSNDLFASDIGLINPLFFLQGGCKTLQGRPDRATDDEG